MNIRQNLFGQGPKAGREQSGGYSRPPAPPQQDDPAMAGYGDPRGGGGYPAQRGSYGDPRSSRPAVGRAAPPGYGQAPASGRPQQQMQLRIAKIEGNATLANQYIFQNL